MYDLKRTLSVESVTHVHQTYQALTTSTPGYLHLWRLVLLSNAHSAETIARVPLPLNILFTTARNLSI